MFECYFLKTRLFSKNKDNLRTELMQWKAHRLRGSLVDNKKNIPWPRNRNLEN